MHPQIASTSTKTYSETDAKGIMAKTLYIGNLPFDTTEDDLRQLLESHGAVESVKLITDRHTGRPRGFGFVDMDSSGADAAISALDGHDFGGRTIRVSEARERQPAGPPRGERGDRI